MLRDDAIAIWKAGLEAVRSETLVAHALHLEGHHLMVGDTELDLDQVRRVVVVGGGKAGAGMAAAVEWALEPIAEAKQLTGWVNVPADCVRPLKHITLHPGRPPGRNEPTEAAVAGTRRILQLVSRLGPHDLCLCLLSGGGSALLTAPAPGIGLDDLQRVTRFLSGAGADIAQLNTVRKQLSRIKGGGLARACRAGRLETLVISDVLGDPLDTIASGPTVPDHSTPRDALEILQTFGYERVEGAAKVLDYLREKERAARSTTVRAECMVEHHIIGNNATAVDAAGEAADRLGYRPAMVCARSPEGLAESVGEHLADMTRRMRSEPVPDCLITGGEPVVQLADASVRGKGGRNQQLVLAAYQRLLASTADSTGPLDGIAILSGGTDGEDGPTDAAGAVLDKSVHEAARRQSLNPEDYLARNDAYSFFEQTGGLLVTGPTHTNVCDVRVVLVDQPR